MAQKKKSEEIDQKSIEDYITNNMSFEGAGDFLVSKMEDLKNYQQIPIIGQYYLGGLAKFAIMEGYDFVTSMKQNFSHGSVSSPLEKWYYSGTGLKRKDAL